ncbi:MAG: cysteine-rich small domain-containing protein [Lachnospiraceae bacterium]|nr:cysteine-rich small domain-containing protein [Lachnospiraceae bacterium]
MSRESEEERKHYRYFSNTECEYFPCHRTEFPENFNCLFCFCPLYMLGESCGGNFRYTERGIKDCTECLLPHKAAGYDYIVEKLREANRSAEQAGQ